MRSTRQKVVAACDYSMPHRKRRQAKGSMYWWNDQLAALRRECLAARRRLTRSKGDSLLHEAWKRAKAALRRGIKKSIDIRNAFNTARWNICIEVMMRKKLPDYLLRMIDDYLSDRWVIYEGNKWSLKEEITCGAPQGSRVGPLVWNEMYDDFPRMDLPAEKSIIGFAYDALVVCAADHVRILELRINETLRRAKRWMEGTDSLRNGS